MLYLAPYTGDGTRENPFKPKGADVGFSSVDLRPDPTVVDGYALLYMPGGTSEKSVTTLGESKDESLFRNTETQVGNILGKTFDGSNRTLSEMVGDLCMSPSTVKGWKPIQPALRKDMPGRYYEVLLNGERFFELPVIAGLTTRTDDFNRTDEGTLVGNWTDTSASSNAYGLTSNQVKRNGTDGGEYSCYWNADSFTNDQFCQVQMVVVDSTMGIFVRGSGVAQDYYACQNFGGSDLFKYVAGSYTSLGSNGTAWSNNDYGRLTATGSSLEFLLDASNPPTTSRVTATDSTFASGKVGLYGFSPTANVTFDNWSGGDLGASQSVVPVLMRQYRARNI